jgi:hypothetical protein
MLKGAILTDPVLAYRQAMTPDQLDVLDAIWARYLGSPPGDWPMVRTIHLSGSDRSRVVAAINSLPPGACLQETGGTPRYALTLLGVLLTREGEGLEGLAARYLDHLRKLLLELRPMSELKATAVAGALNLTPERAVALGRVVKIGGFFGEHFTGGSEWVAGIPENADELVDVPDLRQYVRHRAIERGAAMLDRIAGSNNKRPSEKQLRGDFWFVQDQALRKQLAADRQELRAVQSAKAWKSCVILAGGMLEGMLLDVLSRRTTDAQVAFQKLRRRAAPDLDRWSLADLVEVASEMSILPKGAVRLSHALREFRDLVHPGRQLRENIHLTKDEADIAISVVNICFRALAEFEGRGSA